MVIPQGIPYWTESTHPQGMHHGVPLGIPYWTESTHPQGMHHGVPLGISTTIMDTQYWRKKGTFYE